MQMPPHLRYWDLRNTARSGFGYMFGILPRGQPTEFAGPCSPFIPSISAHYLHCLPYFDFWIKLSFWNQGLHGRLDIHTFHGYRPGVPNLGYMYPKGYICLSEGVHLRLAGDEKIYLRIIYFQIFIHISLSIIFKNHYMLIVKHIYEWSWYILS